MITVIEGLSVFELASSHCVMNNKCLLYFNNALWTSYDETKKEQILAFYSDYAPDDIIEEMRLGRNCVIEYDNEDVAVLNASEWFPPSSVCPDADHFFRALVINQQADIVFENLNPVEG